MNLTLTVLLLLAAADEAPSAETKPPELPLVEAPLLEAELPPDAPKVEASSPRARSVAMELRGWLVKKRTRLLDDAEATTEVDRELAVLEGRIARDDLLESNVDHMHATSSSIRQGELSLRRTRLLEEQPSLTSVNVLLGVGLGLDALSGLGWLFLGVATGGRFGLGSGWLALIITVPLMLILSAVGVAGVAMTIAGAVRLARYNHFEAEREDIDLELQTSRSNDPLPRSESPFALATAR